jgi:hypothetical protein
VNNKRKFGEDATQEQRDAKKTRKKCAIEGCDKYPQGCGGHFIEYWMQEQRDTKKMRNKCAIEGCDKYAVGGCGGHCIAHATQEQRDETNRKGRKSH